MKAHYVRLYEVRNSSANHERQPRENGRSTSYGWLSSLGEKGSVSVMIVGELEAA